MQHNGRQLRTTILRYNFFFSFLACNITGVGDELRSLGRIFKNPVNIDLAAQIYQDTDFREFLFSP